MERLAREAGIGAVNQERTTGERAAPHEKTVEELRAEKAAALGRVGRRLEAALAELARLQAMVLQAHGGRRQHLLRRYEELRISAERDRWYLEVQREAVGFTVRRYLEEAYPLPPPAGLLSRERAER